MTTFLKVSLVVILVAVLGHFFPILLAPFALMGALLFLSCSLLAGGAAIVTAIVAAVGAVILTVVLALAGVLAPIWIRCC